MEKSERNYFPLDQLLLEPENQHIFRLLNQCHRQQLIEVHAKEIQKEITDLLNQKKQT